MAKSGKINAMAALRDILQARVSSGQISVAEIAEKAGLEPSVVYKYMRGDRPSTSLDTFLALLEAVDAHPSDVFGARRDHPKAAIEAAEALLKYLKGK